MTLRLTTRDDVMNKTIEIPFVKLHGLGNDFIVTTLDKLTSRQNATAKPQGNKALPHPKFLRQVARAICDRHIGVGADGFLLILPPQNRQNHARVRFFNADGSEAEMSGNGIRCVAGFLAGRRRAETLRIETVAGLRTLETIRKEKGQWIFRVAMGWPVLEPEKIPFKAPGASVPVIDYPLPTSHGPQCVTVTSMGNPHCSLFVSDFDRIDWRAIGQEIETSSYFPNRTNVEFVRVISAREIEVRYWERGVGQTASSGTGSCAAAVASILNGHTKRSVHVRTLAGTLEISWQKDGEVMLVGPVEKIAQGVYFFSALGR